ncbi:MAG TPA: hypothetical protein VM284_05035 [Candidatus Limnocylindria bacterium]|nr:hypothetical protein [Candidatus Limnocylindria bacterium]
MAQNDVTLIVAALAVVVAVMIWLIRTVTARLGEAGQGLRAVDARLVDATPELAGRLSAVRADLTYVSTQTERALWSLSHFDERADAAREALVRTTTTLDVDRARLIAARGAIIRVQKSARLILKMLELRRAFLG